MNKQSGHKIKLSSRCKTGCIDCLHQDDMDSGFHRNDDKGHIRESGNVLIVILITIVLLGSVTALLTRSGSSTNETGDYERTAVLVDQFLGYSKQVELGLQTLLQRGCSENEISFANQSDLSHTPTYYNNLNSPTDQSCHIFEPEGAGIEIINIKDNLEIFELPTTHYQYFSGSALYHPHAGNDTKADFVLMFTRLNRDFCMAINRRLGIPNLPGDAPDGTANIFGGGPFTGSFGATFANRQFISAGGEMDNQLTGCLKMNGDVYHFYHVMYIR